MGGSMKVHQFARGLWEHESASLSTLGCKRLRPLVPKLQNTNSQNPTTTTSTTSTTTTTHIAHLDLKSFIRPNSGPRNPGSPHQNKDLSQHITAETHPGGTRWNPTQEQIGILEMLYRGGMRTPNAQQIEQITAQLAKYGKIEGKNVFYWFQNHKARERQKQKRNSLGLSHSPRTPPAPPLLSSITLDTPRAAGVVVECTRELEDSPYKRKYRTWGFECLLELESKSSSSSSSCCREEEEVDGDRTLELFPLHPEGRS